MVCLSSGLDYVDKAEWVASNLVQMVDIPGKMEVGIAPVEKKAAVGFASNLLE